MKYFLATLLALSALACGDNTTLPQDTLDEEVLVVPHQGEALTALDSLEEAGFAEPIYVEDGGYILALGSTTLIDEAAELPGIDVIILSRDADPLLPELGIDLVDPSPQRDFSDLEVTPGDESRVD